MSSEIPPHSNLRAQAYFRIADDHVRSADLFAIMKEMEHIDIKTMNWGRIYSHSRVSIRSFLQDASVGSEDSARIDLVADRAKDFRVLRNPLGI